MGRGDPKGSGGTWGWDYAVTNGTKYAALCRRQPGQMVGLRAIPQTTFSQLPDSAAHARCYPRLSEL
jgi:hypothetical protein